MWISEADSVIVPMLDWDVITESYLNVTSHLEAPVGSREPSGTPWLFTTASFWLSHTGKFRAAGLPCENPWGGWWSLHCCSRRAVFPVCVTSSRCVSCVTTWGRVLTSTKPFLYPANQLRGSPVLPEQSVSVEELQGQLAQAARLHQEETETYTNKIRKVNISWGSQHICSECLRSNATMHSKIMLSVACRCPDTQAYRQVIWWGRSLLDASVKTVHLATLKHMFQ